ncbi:hypothetical protein ACO2Q1_12810 [Brevundimonas sp. VNH65]|uniref:hypothetical protein n=1 Tax=Brevundimonas sp. VNH65 TaxID=3400917 RepID=UPI003BFBD9C6
MISYSAFKTGQRVRASRRAVEPIVGEIVHALLTLGGSAHRDTVVAAIAAGRAGHRCAVDSDLRAEVYAGFQRYIDTGYTRRAAPLLHLPLGPGSYRWGLTEAGRRLFAPPPAAARKLH